MRILSLFDGISVARVALERAGIPVEAYYASEIDKYAMQISAKNYPDIVQCGDVKNIRNVNPSFFKTEIDLLIGGSPCQDLSIAKKDRKGLDGERSGLFWEYVRILKEVKPKYFILENVNSMPKEAKQIITETLGVEPIMINASLVSAQNRKRLFWVGKWNGTKYETVPIAQPEDRGILLRDILEDGEGAYIEKQGKMIKNINPEKSQTLMARDYKGFGNQSMTGVVYQYRRTYWRETKGGKVPTLTANMGTGGNNVPYIEQTPRGYNNGGKKAVDGKTPTLSSSSWEHNNKLVDGKSIRKLTILECTRLQSLPDHYLDIPEVSNTQKYKALGNAFNADVITHILSFIKHNQ
jgi:DNA (cytosine-5)-methyltransferase 3A